MTAWPMKLLYDGQCPICSREVDWLRRHNQALRLTFEDIAQEGFDPQQYGLSREQVVAALHGVMADGKVVSGAEAVRLTYAAVGLDWLVAPTRWPVLNALTEAGYRLFARNRLRLGRWLGRSCDAACSTRNK